MELVRLGKSDLWVSQIALGSWQVSGWASSNIDNFKAVFNAGLEAGINFIDTAPSYGKGLAEELLGDLIATQTRDKLIIASKFDHQLDTPEKIRGSLEQSLIRLKTYYLDLYQQHWPSKPGTLDMVMETLLRLKDEGKIRAIGLSNWSENEIKELEQPALLDQVDCFQNCYSLLWRNVEVDILPGLKNRGQALLAYSPLAQGLLSDRNYTYPLPKDYRRQNIIFKAEYGELVQSVLHELREIAGLMDIPSSAVALAWLLNTVNVFPVLGSSSVEQLQQNLLALKVDLIPPLLDRLTAVSSRFLSITQSFRSQWGWHSRKT